LSLVRLRAHAEWRPLALTAAATVTLTALMLASPALWNGYPLAYYDSVDYVLMPFNWDMPIYRTGAYGVFAGIGRLGHSLWAVVLLQSLIVAYVLYEACRRFAPEASLRALVLLTAALALLSGLPWVTSQIIPDAFTGAVVLGALVLAFPDGSLSMPRQIALMCVLAVAGACHSSHLALQGGIILCLLAVRFLASKGWPLLAPKLRASVLVLAAAIGLATGSNWLMTGRAFLVQPSAALTLGLLVQDGLAKRYLDEVCRSPGLYKPRLCMARNRLPPTANDFLWHDADFWRLGGWTGSADEARRIVFGCLHDFPLSYAWTSLKLTFQQLGMVETGDGLTPMEFFIGHAIRGYYAPEVPPFSHAEQQAGIDFTLINEIQVPVQLAGFVALFPLIWLAYRRRDKTSTTLLALVLLALIGNAFVCGALSNPNDRYQSRIEWLALAAAGLGAVRLLRPTRDARGSARTRPEDV